MHMAPEDSSLALQDGSTALALAAHNGHTEVVEQLLAAGAAVDAVNKVRPHSER
jgi:ankyrin repeat protein